MKKYTPRLLKKIISPIHEFISDSRAVGVTLIVCTLISLIWTNTPGGADYLAFWDTEVRPPVPSIHLPHTLLHWINDGLMALFFLLVGMEIKRELLVGELAGIKKAALPVFAALGGMVVPALLYTGWNVNSGFGHGWGVPMATDIAFSLGILSLLGSRAPLSLKILLTALAIIDDLGAIVAIALFYTDSIHWGFLGGAGLLFLLLVALNVLKVKRLYPYFIVGVLLWYFLFNSGVHATLAGVLLAFTLPLSRLTALEHSLHDPVSFLILPLFALANTAIVIPTAVLATLDSPIHYGILSGLALGKPLGIVIFSMITVRLGLCALPKGLNWKQVTGMGLIAGIGFTMSIFISMLAFSDWEAQTVAKLAVLIASLLSGVAGYLYLRLLGRRTAGNLELTADNGGGDSEEKR